MTPVSSVTVFDRSHGKSKVEVIHDHHSNSELVEDKLHGLVKIAITDSTVGVLSDSPHTSLEKKVKQVLSEPAAAPATELAVQNPRGERPAVSAVPFVQGPLSFVQPSNSRRGADKIALSTPAPAAAAILPRVALPGFAATEPKSFSGPSADPPLAPPLNSDVSAVVEKPSIKYIRPNYGVVTFPDGGVYVGDLLRRWDESRGVLTYPDGKFHSGTFRNKKLFSGEGTIRLRDGSVYTGPVHEGKWHGQGKLSYPNEKVLEGEFREGKIYQGQGTMMLSCGGSFEGIYIEGKKQGQGKITYADGRTLEGEWRNNKFCNGKGTLVTGDQQALTGEWENFRFFSTEHLNFLVKNAAQEQKPQGLFCNY